MPTVKITPFPSAILGNIPACYEKKYDTEQDYCAGKTITITKLYLRDEKRDITLTVFGYRGSDDPLTMKSRFKKDGEYRSFDRRGIEDTACISKAHKCYDQTVEEAIKSFEERYEKAMSAPPNIKIPGTQLEVSPERLAQIKANLASGNTAMIAPGGMGQGIFVTPNRPTRRRDGFLPCPQPWCEIFGIPRLWYQPVDCD